MNDHKRLEQLLGHTSIETTARYTHVQEATLKKMFKSHHPRENELYREADDDYRQAADALMAELLRKWRNFVTLKGAKDEQEHGHGDER